MPKEPTLIKDDGHLTQVVEDAFTGHGRFQVNYWIARYKEALIQYYGLDWRDVFQQVYVDVLETFRRVEKMAVMYAVQCVHNSLRKQYNLARNNPEVLECQLEGLVKDKADGLTPLDILNVRLEQRQDDIEDWLIETYENKVALDLADCDLTDTEKRMYQEGLSVREASQIDGVAKSTFNDRHRAKLGRIKDAVAKL